MAICLAVLGLVLAQASQLRGKPVSLRSPYSQTPE